MGRLGFEKLGVGDLAILCRGAVPQLTGCSNFDSIYCIVTLIVTLITDSDTDSDTDSLYKGLTPFDIPST